MTVLQPSRWLLQTKYRSEHQTLQGRLPPRGFYPSVKACATLLHSLGAPTIKDFISRMTPPRIDRWNILHVMLGFKQQTPNAQLYRCFDPFQACPYFCVQRWDNMINFPSSRLDYIALVIPDHISPAPGHFFFIKGVINIQLEESLLRSFPGTPQPAFLW